MPTCVLYDPSYQPHPQAGRQPAFACIAGQLYVCSLEQLTLVPTARVIALRPPQAADRQANGEEPLFDCVVMVSDIAVMPAEVVFVAFRQLIGSLKSYEAQRLTQAMQLMRWQLDYQFCSRCGTRLSTHQLKSLLISPPAICASCQHRQYPQIQPCTITAVIRTKHHVPELLLACHQRAKHTGVYTLLAGFVEVGETLEDCVRREVAEEVGVQVDNIRYLASQPWAYPSNLMMGFVADYAGGELQLDSSELVDARFFSFDELVGTNRPSLPPVGTIAYQIIQQLVQPWGR